MRRLVALVAIAAAAACARQGFPPGGPPRSIPPHIVSIAPESGAVNVHFKTVTITFDEVVAERPSGGAQSLSDLVLISPRDGAPKVAWHRTRIDVRGQRAWKANTAYTVTLRPGTVDLHGNVLRRAVTIVFSTGATIPATMISGVVFDWATGKPVPNALVQVDLPPDSTAYLTLADTNGRFTLGTLPPGTVTVRGLVDANSNRALDPREAWDTATVTLRDSVRVELYAFIHDTVGPRINTVDVRDSMTLRVTFDKPLDPASLVDTANFVLRAVADSQIVPVRAVRGWREFERARMDSIAHADSLAGKRDTAAEHRRVVLAALAALADTIPKIPPPVASRPLPLSEFLLFLARPLVPGVWYRLEAHGVRNLLGDTATSLRTVQMPKPAPPPPPKPAAKAGAAVKPDSTPPKPPPPHR